MSKEQVNENENADGADGDEEGIDEGAAAASAADGGQDGADAGDDHEGAAGDEIYRPEGLADHLIGANNQETIDKLSEAYLGARKELSKKRGVPEKIDDYSIDLPEDVAAAILKTGEDGKDPHFEKARGVLHKHNIPAEAATELLTDFYKEVMAGMAEGGGEGDAAADQGNAADLEYKELGGADKAKPQIDGARVFIDGLKSSGKLSEKAADELELLTYHSQGLSAINEIRALLGDKAIPSKIEGGAAGSVTEASLQARVADERYWKHQDPVYIAETTRMFEEFYGGEKKTA